MGKRGFYLFMFIALFVCQTAMSQTICDQYGILSINGGEYILQNNVWGASTAQCVTYNGGTGFTVSTSAHNQGSVAGYPSLFKGNHWGTATSNSGMPLQISAVSSANFSFNVSSTRPSGDYNVAAEAWISPSTDVSAGYGGGAEIMIVLDYHGVMGPAGSQIGTFNGHQVYYTNIGWNFLTYVATGRSSASGNIMDFINDAMSRGYVQPSWYLHVFEAGFEIMSGGQGLTCNSFSFSVNGGGGGTNPTSTPTRTPTPVPAANTPTPPPTTSNNIPGLIEAENYTNMSGIQTETCSEGGLNVGWIEAGDWMDYNVNVASAGSYTVQYRVASLSSTISFSLREGNSILGSISAGSTGGWQTWTTVSHTVSLSAGSRTLRVYADGGGWNINWLNFISGSTNATATPTSISAATATPVPAGNTPTPTSRRSGRR